MMAEKIFTIPTDVFGRLESGEDIREGSYLNYVTYGDLNDTKTNCVLWMTCYSQRTPDMVTFIGPGKRFDCDRLFLVTVNMIGNGLSMSPVKDKNAWPKGGFTYGDTARAVNLLLQSLGVTCVALCYGFSMGAMFAFEYCVRFPDAIKTAVATCGSAKCNPANQWFLTHLADALRNDANAEVDPETKRIVGFNGVPQPKALDTFAGIYADWILDAPRPESDGALCPNSARPEFARSIHGEGRAYLENLHGFASTDAWMTFFRARYDTWDVLEYYEVSDMWRRGDVSKNDVYRGDLKKALSAIRAAMWILPGNTDQYFRAEEIAEEAKMVPNATFEPLVSSMGHMAEFDDACQPAINKAIAAALAYAGL